MKNYKIKILGIFILYLLVKCDFFELHNPFDETFIQEPVSSNIRKHGKIRILQGSTDINSNGHIYDFGNIQVKEDLKSAVYFQIENTGNRILTLTNNPDFIEITGTDRNQFNVVQPEINTIFPNSSTVFSIAFSPESSGEKSANIRIPNTDIGKNPFVFQVKGIGTTNPIPDINIKKDTTDITNKSGQYDFGEVQIGFASSPVIFTIENIGSADLSLMGDPFIQVLGSGSDDFKINQPGITSISVGNKSAFSIVFEPKSQGLKTVNISIRNNDTDEDPYEYKVIGTGTVNPVPDINVRHGSANITQGYIYNFGDVTENSKGSSVQFSIENTGKSDLILNGKPFISIDGVNTDQFNITQPSINILSANSSTVFTVTFFPQDTGIRVARIEIKNNDSDENPFIFTVLGNSIDKSIPDINVRQGLIDIVNEVGVYDFGNTELDTPSPEVTFVLENKGNANLNLTGADGKVEIKGSDSSHFIIKQPILSTLPAGNNTAFTIRFFPNSLGMKISTVSINNNDTDENPYTFTVRGESMSASIPDIHVKQGSTDLVSNQSTYDFGLIQEGSSSTNVVFSIENSGKALLVLTDIYISGTNANEFLLKSPPSSIPVGESRAFSVKFSPQSVAVKNAILTIESNDIDESEYIFNLLGKGSEIPVPDINIRQNSIDLANKTGIFDFGEIQILSSSPAVTFTIQNTGGANLRLTRTPAISMVGNNTNQFILNQTGMANTILPDSRTTFSLRFSPDSLDEKSAEIIMYTNDNDENPYSFLVIGTGTAPPIPEIRIFEKDGVEIFSGTSNYDFGNIQINQESDQITFNIWNFGQGDLTLAGNPYISLTGSHPGQFIISQPNAAEIPISPNDNTSFNISFQPDSIGLKQANITVSNNDADESSFSFSISGECVPNPVSDIDIRLNTVSIPSGTGEYDFEGTGVGNSESITLTIVNTGTGTLNLTDSPYISLSGSNANQFSIIQPLASAVAASGMTNFGIIFSPASDGNKRANISIATNDPDENPYEFIIRGEGTVSSADYDKDGDVDLADLAIFTKQENSLKDFEEFASQLFTGLSIIPIAWWKLDIAITKNDKQQDYPAEDSAGNFDGIITKGTYTKKGIMGNGVNLDGGDDHAYVANPPLLNTFSIAFWVSVDDSGNNGDNWWSGKGIIDGDVLDYKEDFGITLIEEKIAFGIGENGAEGSTIKSSSDVTISSKAKIGEEWHHVVVTRDGISGEMKIYIDGELKASGTGPTGPRIDTSQNKICFGGMGTELDGKYIKGRLDDVRIYDVILLDNGVEKKLRSE